MERQAAPLGIEHPPGDLQGGAGELIALDQGEAVEEILCRLDVLPDDPRRHVLAHGVEGGLRVLGGVAGQQGRTALTPGHAAATFHTHEYRVGVVLVRVGGLPDEGEGELRPVDVDAFDPHVWALSREVRQQRRCRVTLVEAGGGAVSKPSPQRGNDRPAWLVHGAQEEIIRILRSSAAPLSLAGCLLLATGCASSYASLAPERVDAVPAGAYHVKVSENRGAGPGSAAVLREEETRPGRLL